MSPNGNEARLGLPIREISLRLDHVSGVLLDAAQTS